MSMNATTWNRLRYTLYAPIYDGALRLVPVFSRGRKRAVELAALQPGERVLLVACGTGLDLDLLPMGVHVVAVNITPAMIEQARPPSPHPRWARWWVSRARRLALGCGRFDD